MDSFGTLWHVSLLEIRTTVEILRIEQDFSYCTCNSARVDSGQVLGSEIEETDQVSVQP